MFNEFKNLAIDFSRSKLIEIYMLKIYLKIKVYFSVNNCDIIVESSCIFNKKRNPLNVNNCVKKETLKVRIVLENLRVRSSKTWFQQANHREASVYRFAHWALIAVRYREAGTATCL